MNLQINLSQGGNQTLDRVIEAYGFKTKVALAEHLGIASSSLANRYKRDFFPSDIVVRCMAETGATLEWLATGNGPKFAGVDLDILRITKQKVVDGQLYDDGMLMLDKATFQLGKAIPIQPICIIDGLTTFVIEREFSEIFDGEWLVEVEGKTSVKTLTRIPVKRVRVGGSGSAFDCAIEDINVIGRVALTIING